MASSFETFVQDTPNPMPVPLPELNRSNLKEMIVGIGRAALRTILGVGLATTVGIASGTAMSVADRTPMPAEASGGYPDSDKVCVAGPNKGKSTGIGYWCTDYRWGDITRDANGKEVIKEDSPRGYGYRNCTDWAAFRIPQLVQVNVPTNLGNAGSWDNNIRGYTVDNSPEPGDIAVWDPPTPEGYGHVEVVESVNADGSVNTSGYNKKQDGTYGTQSNVRANHYIDLNGTGKGINGEDLGGGQSNTDKAVTAVSSQITPDGTTHVYWADQTGKLKETWFKNGVKHTNVIKDFGITDVTEVSSQFTGADGLQHVYAGTSGGEVWEFWFGPNTGGYQGRLITDADSEVTAMSSMITPDGFHRIYWATKNRQLYETWFGNGQNGGTYLKDTSNSHIQAITSQYTADGTRRIYWGNDEGRLHERRINGAATELRLMADFPEEITALASLTTPDGQQHIYSGDDTGQIRETWFNPGGSYNTWPVRNLGSAVLAISGAYTPHDGLQHIYAGSATGNLSEIWFRPGWIDSRAIPLNPAPAKITALSSQYTPNDMAQHIYWGAPDGIVRESWFGPTGSDTWSLPT